MATKLITSDEQLRKYIPNMFSTAKGETPFYERLQPWLETAERWLFDNFTGDYLNLLVRTDEGDEVLRGFCFVGSAPPLRGGSC